MSDDDKTVRQESVERQPENDVPKRDTIPVSSDDPPSSRDAVSDGEDSVAAPPMPPIDGYEVLEEIGRGGMGVVYRARQLAAGGRVVALKVMLGEAFARPHDLRRFEREVEIAAELNHPHIARIYDSGLTYCRHFFAMEYVVGEPLDRYCASHALRIEDRLRIFAAVCEAVAFAHRRGIIHRDLKPSNILVDTEGSPHILDFGLAKTASAPDGEELSLLTMDGTLLGTLPYMAPEQAEGRIAAVDTRTDVYALGVVLYELLTGKYPYEVTGQMADVLKRIAEAEPRRPSTVNRLVGDEVETIILRALNKAPDRRYSSADDLARDIGHFLAGEPIEAKRDSGMYVLRKTMRRHRVALAFAAAIIVLLAASSVVSFALYRRAEGQRALAESARTEELRQRTIAQANAKLAEAARQEALASARESAWRLARSHFNNGVSRWFDRDDPVSAAACFVEALGVSPEEFPAARIALRNVLERCPQMICAPVLLKYGRTETVLSRDGSRVATDGGLVIELVSGQQIGRSAVQGFPRAFSPDGTRILTAAGGGTRVWDVATGRAISPPLQDHKFRSRAAFSPDGRWVVTVPDDKTARVWDVATGQPVSAPMRHDDSITGRPEFSANGKYLVTISKDGRARVWNAATGVLAFAPDTKMGSSHGAAFSPDSKWLLTAPAYMPVQIWDTSTGQSVTVPMEVHGGENPLDGIRDAMFSPDGKNIIISQQGGKARVWNVASGQAASAPMRHGEAISTFAFSSDGKRIVTASWDKTARVWDAATGLPLSYPLRNGGTVVGATFTADGKRVVTESHDRTVRAWDVPANHSVSRVLPQAGRVDAAAFSPDGKRLATTSSDKITMARVWDPLTGQPISPPMQPRDYSGPPVFSPDGKRVVFAGNKTAQVWDAATGKPISGPLEHEKWIHSVAFTADGSRVVTESGDMAGVFPEKAQMWDATTGRAVPFPVRDQVAVQSALFSPDGRRLALLLEKRSPQGKLSVADTTGFWDVITGQPLCPPVQNRGEVLSMVFSPDGERIFIRSTDSDATRVWDTSTGRPVSEPIKIVDEFRRAVFSPDGTRLVIAANKVARVWDAATGQSISAPMQHGEKVSRVSFSPDGRWVLTASEDQAVQIWDAATGQPVSAVLRTKSRVRAAAFAPGGNRVISVSASGELDIWPMEVDWNEPGELIRARVRARLGVAVAPTGAVEPLSAEELAAAWSDYQRLQADYERTRPKKDHAN